MKLYFPQWQGSGNGISILHGARTILDYVNDASIVQIPLSTLASGKEENQKQHINNYEALVEQLGRLKNIIVETGPDHIQIIGGDCGLEIVPVSYLNMKYPKLGVIWFDAHADINRPCDSPSGNFHGMPLRTLLGEGEPMMDKLMFSQIMDTQIHYVGLRDVDEGEQKRITEGNIYAPVLLDIPHLTETLRKKGIAHLYLHFDFDCLEPSDYDKTYYRVAKGLTLEQAESCIEALKNSFTVVGSSVLESTAIQQNDLQPVAPIINALMA